MIAIGARPRRPSADIGEALLECHGRIRDLCALAMRLAAAEGAGDYQIIEAARRLHHYFSEALPLHVADEDEIVAAEIAGLDPVVDAALYRMGREHREHEPAIADLIGLAELLENEPGRHRELRQRLTPVAFSLDRDLGGHLAHEEAVIIPALSRLVEPGRRIELLGVLRARRQEK